jgi:anti-sigma B factor antagonist
MGKRSSESEISVRVFQANSQPAVKVGGRVTVDSSPRLRSALLSLLQRTSGGTVLIDLADVQYLDMSGIATLLEALMSARERSVKLRVVGVRDQVRMLADIAELSKIYAAAGSEVVLS